MLDKGLDHLIESLHEIGCIKFGEFTLKSGLKSPIYFDLRVIVSYPKVMKLVSDHIYDMVKKSNLDYDIVCGVPYGAIAIATSLSISADKPMILKRKESKAYGTKNMVEGIYRKDDRCLLVEDVVTYGDSILETVKCLNEYNITVKDVVVILDRQQGGSENVENHGVKFHSLITSTAVLDVLLSKKKLTQEKYDETKKFLAENNCIKDASLKIFKNGLESEKQEQKELDFDTRAKLCTNQISKRLFEIMSMKKTNLCIAADVLSMDELLKIADDLGPHICMLKTHVDIIEDFDYDRMQQLKQIANKHEFLIFEDRKFADIGNTVKHQYVNGVYKISKWSHIVNAHSIAGPGTVDALKNASEDDSHQAACLLIGEMSSKGNLISEQYTKDTVSMAESNSDFVIGFICQNKLAKNPKFLHICPGVQLNETGDSLGQQYVTPSKSIIDNKCDIIIVGRGILSQTDRVKAAINYKNLAYNAYLERVSNLN